jgi:hypothetical protein
MTAKTAARIAKLMAEGMDIRTAFDAVLGAGAYAAFASDLYDTLQEGK